MRGGCGVNRMDGENNENVCRKFGMSSKGRRNELCNGGDGLDVWKRWTRVN